MARLTDRERLDANHVLYDPDTLTRLMDMYGSPAEIKMNVKTTAKQYEIRTALRFWSGGKPSHRTTKRVWDACEEIEKGNWELSDDNEVVYA